MKNIKPHIVFLTPGFAESEKDSTTIPALQVYLKQLKKIIPDAKMSLIAFQFPFSKTLYIWNGINIIPLNGKNKKYKKLWIWKKSLSKLKEIHKQQPITTIHSFWIGECSLIGSRFAKRHNIKHITTVMGQDANIGNRYAKALRNASTEIVTLSGNHQSTLFKNYKLDSVIIPWCLDTTSFPELQDSKIDILGVGSLNKVKNYSLFISTIADLVKTYPNLKVEIIGEGTMRTQLEKQIEDLELTKNITLIGQLPRQQVLDKMSQAQVLLHTSAYESFGFVFLEALYTGMQIVSFNVGVAKSISEWQICSNPKVMTEACEAFLTKSKKDKKRICITNKETSISSYIKLYYE